MWAEIITIKKDFNYFSQCALNLLCELSLKATHSGNMLPKEYNL